MPQTNFCCQFNELENTNLAALRVGTGCERWANGGESTDDVFQNMCLNAPSMLYMCKLVKCNMIWWIPETNLKFEKIAAKRKHFERNKKITLVFFEVMVCMCKGYMKLHADTNHK